MLPNYTNLVFKGGGVKGIAYAGALQILSEQNILQNIKRVAGTSAGAITAALVCLGYKASEVRDIIFNLDFKRFEDGWDPLRIVSKYGLYQGDHLLQWTREVIGNKAAAGSNATFADLQKQGLPSLYTYATDLNTFNVKQFSCADTPDTVVAEAIRASMSIPIFFRAWQFTDCVPDDHIYVDGGMVWNYPLTVFDSASQPDNEQTLGLYLYDLENLKTPSTFHFDEPIEYGKILFETLLESQDIDFSVSPALENRTVIIDDFGILATDFNITADQKNRLFESGKQYTSEYLLKHSCHTPV